MLYVPVAQLTQTANELEYLPAAQGRQAALPDRYVPSGHPAGSQKASPATLNVDDAHGLQKVAPLALYLPAGHSVHADGATG
jgi:hypothetical protein